MRRKIAGIVLLGVVLLLSGCSKKNEAQSEPAEAAAETYQGRGVVVSIADDHSYLVINHEAIPGFMAAMSMPFAVEDSTLLKDIQPKDSVYFTISLGKDHAYISKIRKKE